MSRYGYETDSDLLNYSSPIIIGLDIVWVDINKHLNPAKCCLKDSIFIWNSSEKQMKILTTICFSYRFKNKNRRHRCKNHPVLDT